MRNFFWIFSALLIIYGLGSLLTNRINIGIVFIILLGMICLVVGIYFRKLKQYVLRRKKLKRMIIIVLSIGLLSAVSLEALLLSGMIEKHPKTVDYILVYGAGVKNGSPTPVLRNRLRKAIEMHVKYPESKLIVSGGLDTGEQYTEAFVMKEYLIINGIPEQLIIIEDKATSTKENVDFSQKLMSGKSPEVMVVTSDYHLFRASYYANKAGLTPYRAGASIPLSIVPLTHLREMMGIGKMLVEDVLD
jgi:uncharacterized SAM-binding protein YcdF (DUF218 family)